MNEMHKPRHIFRSIGAVLAGMAAGIILSLGTDIVLHAVGVFPPWGLPVSEAPLLLATAYRAVYGLLPIGPCSTPWQAAPWALS